MEAVEPLGWKRPVSLGVVAAVAFALVAPAPARAEFKFLTQWGAPSGGELIFPFDVDRDNAGNTYAIDIFTPAVQKYDSANNHVLSWGSLGSGPGQFDTPFAVGVNEATGDVYVGDLSSGPTPTIRVQRFDTNGNFLGQWGSAGSAEGQFAGVLRLAVSSTTGDVFTVETNRVQRFSSTGQFELMWGKDVVPGGGAGAETCAAGCKGGETGTAEGELNFPSDIAVNAANQVFVSEDGNARISRFNATTGAFQLMGGADVVPGGGTGAETCAAACKAGVRGSGNGALDDPRGIDATGAFVWIADQDNHRVQRWTNNLGYVSQFGSEGTADGLFRSPEGLAENGGTVVVTDSLPSRLQTFTGAGAFAASFAQPGAGTLTLAAGIAAGPGGVYVTDVLDRVLRYDDQGALFGRWALQGGGGPASPSGLAVAPNGDVYAVDLANSRIQRFSSSGAALGTWGTPGTNPGQFSSPNDVAVAPDGSVYVLETARVQKFSPIGAFEGTWGAQGEAPGQLSNAQGIATDRQGNVYVADYRKRAGAEVRRGRAVAHDLGLGGHRRRPVHLPQRRRRRRRRQRLRPRRQRKPRPALHRRRRSSATASGPTAATARLGRARASSTARCRSRSTPTATST